MKNIVIFTLAGVGIFRAWEQFGVSKGLEPLSEDPYVAVYGKDTCGWAQKMVKDLARPILVFAISWLMTALLQVNCTRGWSNQVFPPEDIIFR